VGVIGLPWEEVHIEACRWEHVISDSVERRIVELLEYPVCCPHGNIIPGLDELGVPEDATKRAAQAEDDAGVAMTKMALRGGEPVVVRRISEQIQSDAALMLRLKKTGIQPGREVTLALSNEGIRVTGGDTVDGLGDELPQQIAAHVFVSRL
jgi:DtxR family Mn-dependent transcriptional regulator